LLIDAVVAESVVVIKKLLQMISEKDEEEDQTMKDVIIHLAQLLDNITAPKARASIVWVIGEYSNKVPLIAPDILRKLAKNFVAEVSFEIVLLNISGYLR
jgi:AP-3 complex subunit beta